jgi:hypothetical protein
MQKLFTSLLLIFIMQIAFADYIVCDINYSKYFALYEINEYHCDVGYFLPANTLGCRPCPNGFTCPGGIFEFNPDEYQGLYLTGAITQTINNVCAVNFPSNIPAIYTPNVHECASGYYMPANTDGCVVCPENNYCVGGTYTFNETVTQGILPCLSSHPYAPVGMWAESQCGRKLYVGGEYLYLHQSPAEPAEHRLYARIETGVYSANATPVSERPDLKMSANTQRALHVKIDGIEYLIHDDSVK